MCIVIYALNAHPKYRLILSTNRDEFLARPTSAAAWRDGSLETVGAQQGVMGEVLGGRDEVGGGMWFGMNNRGRVGILTNFTETPAPVSASTPSRGALLPGYLTSPSPLSPETYLASLAPQAQDYPGFNLLLFSLFPPPNPTTPIEGEQEQGGRGEAWYLSNRSPSGGGGKRVEGDNGVGGLSNSVWEDPWKKVVDCRDVLAGLLEQEKDSGHDGWTESKWVQELEGMLSNSLPPSPSLPYPLSQAPTYPPFKFPLPPTSTLALDAAQANPSPLTPSAPRWYGPRLRTTLLVTHTGEYTFIERDVWVLDPTSGEPVRVEKERSKGTERRFTGRLEMSDAMIM